MSQYFLSTGHIFISNLDASNLTGSKKIQIFPFLELTYTDFYGETKGPQTNILRRSYPATLYTVFNAKALSDIKDIKNRIQIEKKINPILEIYFISHTLLHGSTLEFQYFNTKPCGKADIPNNITPLEITVPSDLPEMWKQQNYIRDYRTVRNTSASVTRLQKNEDLSWSNYTFVKPAGSGGMIMGLVTKDELRYFHHKKNIYDKIIANKTNNQIVKALYYFRRGLGLENHEFYSEAYLNYVKVLEALAGSYKDKDLQKNLSLDKALLIGIARIRGNVVAHGNYHISFMREVGQMEFYRLKEKTLEILRNKFK